MVVVRAKIFSMYRIPRRDCSLHSNRFPNKIKLPSCFLWHYIFVVVCFLFRGVIILHQRNLMLVSINGMLVQQ